MSKLLSETFQKLEACIHCGMCLPACPTYRVTGSEAESPRGRLYLMKALITEQLESPQQLATHLDPCLGCLGCQTACPSGVEYGTLLMASREKLVMSQPWPKRWVRRFLLKVVLPSPWILNVMALLLKAYQQSGIQSLVQRVQLPRLLGPLGLTEQFIPQIQPGKPLQPGKTYGKNQKGRVALFAGCIMNAAFHQTHQATIAVLVENGYEVVIPKQTCCGALAHHSGETDIAQTLAHQNIDAILAAQPDWIVVNAAGCGSTLKDYHHLVQHHPQSEAFSHKVVDVMALLAQHPLAGKLHALPLKVTYHAACHLHHAQGVQQEPYAVLTQIPELDLIPLVEAEMCCGSAGVYNLAHPEMSVAILQDKMRHLQNTGAQFVLAGNPGCMLQLEAGIRSHHLPIKVLHPIELLAMAYRPTEG